MVISDLFESKVKLGATKKEEMGTFSMI